MIVLLSFSFKDGGNKLQKYIGIITWGFWISLALTFVLPIGAIIWQCMSVGYSYDPYNQRYWQGITNTFNFQIELVKILGGITAMLGLLYRSIQTQIQIQIAEAQVVQTKKKDNLTMYFEHRKYITNKLLESIKYFNNSSQNTTPLIIKPDKIYDSFFAKNNVETGVIDTKAELKTIVFNFRHINIDTIKNNFNKLKTAKKELFEKSEVIINDSTIISGKYFECFEFIYSELFFLGFFNESLPQEDNLTVSQMNTYAKKMLHAFQFLFHIGFISEKEALYFFVSIDTDLSNQFSKYKERITSR